MKIKLSPVRRITFAAMLVVLDTFFIALSKVTVIPGISYVRVSFGPAIVIYASLVLGPLYGGIVGLLGDLLGMIIAPIGTYNVFITLINVLYGVLPWLFMKLTRLVRNSFKKPWLLLSFIVISLVGTTLFLYLTPTFDNTFKEASVWAKPVVLGVMALCEAGLIIGLYGTNRYFKRRLVDAGDLPSPNEVATVSFVTEFLLGVIGNTGAILFYFRILMSGGGNDYSAKTLATILPFFLAAFALTSAIDTFTVSWLLIYGRRFIGSDK